MSERRVVITGLGLVTPVGLDADETWSALCAGRSGVRRVSLLGEGSEARYLAADVVGLEVRRYVPDRKLLRVMCRTDHLGLAAAQLAVSQSGAPAASPERRGAFLGTSKSVGPFESVFDAQRASRGPDGEPGARGLGAEGFPLIPPMTLVTGLSNGCLFAVSVLHEIRGSNTSFVGSGEAGLLAAGAAWHAVKQGDVEWALAAAHDTGVTRWAYADFLRLGLLSAWTGEPAQAVKSFDVHRDGFVVGEGAGALVLEELSHAQARQAPIVAEVLGWASTCDAATMVSPKADGSALAACLSRALAEAGVGPEEVDYVNAYGSATPSGDRTELRALNQVFQGARPLVSSTKGATGHLLAASGAVELGVTALALREGVAPPTLNLREPDPECAFDCLPGQARSASLRHALTISRGIGGQNAAMVLRRWEG